MCLKVIFIQRLFVYYGRYICFWFVIFVCLYVVFVFLGFYDFYILPVNFFYICFGSIVGHNERTFKIKNLQGVLKINLDL